MGAFSGSLMPPSRKPFETCALSCVSGVTSKLAMTRGATPVARTVPSLSSGSANSPSNTCVRRSSKSYQRRPPVSRRRSVTATDTSPNAANWSKS